MVSGPEGPPSEVEALWIQKAVAVAHDRARKWFRVRSGLAAGSAVLGVIGGVVVGGRSGDAVVAGGLVMTIAPLMISAVLAGRESAAVGLAARLADQFDRRVFGLDLSAFDSEPAPDDVIGDLAARFDGDPDVLSKWYPDVSALAPAVGAMTLQRLNLGWDTALRRRWGRLTGLLGIAWFSLGSAVAIAGNWSVADYLLRWGAPSAALAEYLIESSSRHRSIADERARLEIAALALLEEGGGEAPDMADVADLQTRIHHLRRQAPRLPEWFQTHHRRALGSWAASEHARITALRSPPGQSGA